MITQENILYTADEIKAMVKTCEKYNAALERAKKLYEKGTITESLGYVFPELKETDAERIRKAIYNALKYLETELSWDFVDEVDILDAYAWLEKQNPVWREEDESWFKELELMALSFSNDVSYRKEFFDWLKSIKDRVQHKVEPKFKVGDWITDGYIYYKITEILDDRYIIESKYDKKGAILFEYENRYHLWAIQDAKDGDVLVNGSNIFIFHFINGTRLMGYCHVNIDDGRFYDDIGRNECFCLIDAVVTPATKEQHELLFQKMKEAGYEWSDKWLNHNPQTKQCEHLENYDDEQEKIDWSTITDEDIAKVFSELPTVKIEKDEDERIRKGLIKAVSRIFEGHKLFDTDVLQELNKIKEEIKELKEELKKINNRRRWK